MFIVLFHWMLIIKYLDISVFLCTIATFFTSLLITGLFNFVISTDYTLLLLLRVLLIATAMYRWFSSPSSIAITVSIIIIIVSIVFIAVHYVIMIDNGYLTAMIPNFCSPAVKSTFCPGSIIIVMMIMVYIMVYLRLLIIILYLKGIILNLADIHYFLEWMLLYYVIRSCTSLRLYKLGFIIFDLMMAQ